MLSVFRVNDDDCYKWPGLYISSAPYLIWICVHQYINVRPNLASSIPPPPPLKYLYLTWLPLQFVWLHCKRQKFGLWLQRTRGMPDCILYRDTIEYKNPSECDDGHPQHRPQSGWLLLLTPSNYPSSCGPLLVRIPGLCTEITTPASSHSHGAGDCAD